MADHTPRALLRALDERDGHVCAWHGPDASSRSCAPGTLVPQHRQGGMGGRVDKHRLSNLVWLCSLMNGAIEAEALAAADARELGLKIADSADPERAAVWHAVHGHVRLKDDGSVEPIQQERWDR